MPADSILADTFAMRAIGELRDRGFTLREIELAWGHSEFESADEDPRGLTPAERNPSLGRPS